ncbi:MAG: thrombospondin type 3 repeat-containing protein, partial [Candidatus Poseidoniaceae archaeon]|nr:thrombospondin type 3 repeat-containing protein [Candidatus Poseidoniaceae archaeon]
MRTHFNAATALLLTALMLTSLFAIQQPAPVEELEEESNPNEPLFTSGRSSSASILASGSGANNEFGDHIEALPMGGWVIGSEFNSTLTYGTKTLNPTSPYRQNNGLGEFFLGIMNEQGVWTNLVGADHNYGSGGLSFISDVTIGMAGEIFVSGYFYGEIAFGPPNPNTLISNTNSGFHFEGFIAKADPTGNWMWAKGFSTLVNGTGENSRTTSIQVDMMGDLFVTGTFQGETDFGGMSLNATTQDVYVAKYDGNQGTLSWVIYGGGIGTDSVFDMAITPSNGVKLATATNSISQWGTSNYVAVGIADAVIVEIDANAVVLGITGMGTPNQETLVLQMRIDGSGDTYLSGTFGGTLSSSGWTATAAYGGNDIFIAKSASNQANSWATVSGTSSTDQPQGLAITSNGGVVFGGFLTSTFYAGSKSLSNQNVDGFAVGLSPNGAVDWIERIGGSGYDYVFSMASNNSDYVGLAGSFTGSMTHKGKQISSGGNYDIYSWIFDPSSLKDTDGDGVLDSAPDNCPTVPNSDQANTDGDSQGDACDSDDDNDGLTDNFPDNCPRGGEFNWTSSRDFNDPASSTDWDNDGCKDDSTEDTDDDNDGVADGVDACPRTSYAPPRPTWISDSAT